MCLPNGSTDNFLCQDSNKPIYLYINSAGGSVIAGLSIYDTMQT